MPKLIGEKCAYCLGAGFLDVPTYWCEDACDYIMKESDCPQCGGTGIIKNSDYEFDMESFSIREFRKKT